MLLPINGNEEIESTVGNPMEFTMLLLLVTFLLIGIYVFKANSTRRRSKLPPGPYPFPVIGSIFMLGALPHQSLANLIQSYGHFFSLKLGSMTAIVISSPKIAKEVLIKYDQYCASRSVPNSCHALDHHNNSLVFLPSGSRWRNLRKICKEHIFASQRVEASQGLRRKAVDELIEYVRMCCDRGEAVDIGSLAFTASLNAPSNFFFSANMASYQSSSSQEFKDLVWGVLQVLGKPNLANYFPILKLIDPQGQHRQARYLFGKLLGIFRKIIEERLQARAALADDASSACHDILDNLLNICLKNEYEMNVDRLCHLLQDLFVAGNDTTSSTVEWAMAELLHAPQKFAKARYELLEVIGRDGNGVVQESDMSRLPYLQAVIKETLRLHPVAPFLVPHRADEDIEIEGFLVPKNAQILVNVWATARDSSIWAEPESFIPERFLGSEIDFKGQHFELIPFGAGRRMCPGLALAHKLVHLMVGSLIYYHEWKLEGGIKAEDIDMSEEFGLTLHKAAPLKAIPVKQ